jgi:hypothetical protein
LKLKLPRTAEIPRSTANGLMPVPVRIRISEVERVVPNALFDSAIRKRLEDKSLHPRYRAKGLLAASRQATQRLAEGLGMTISPVMGLSKPKML